MIVFILRIAVVIVALIVLPVTSALAGIDELYQKPDSEKSEGELVADFVGYGGYQKSYALVVGISQYSVGYSPLPTKNDALRMRDFLVEDAGFDYVRTVTDEKVSPALIRSVMLNEFRNKIDWNDRFVFYWSGHGIDVENAIGGKEGFLPVANSPRDAIETMVSMADIRRWDSLIRADQALYLLDACFSGLAVSSKSDPLRLDPTAMRQYNIAQLARPSHHLISAGTAQEETIASADWGGSLFTWAVLRGLRGAADAQSDYPRDGLVSLSELIAYLKLTIEIERQSKGWNKKITPQKQDLRSNEGEFFFITNEEKISHLNKRGGQPTGEFAFGKPVAKNTLPRPGPDNLSPSEQLVRETQEILPRPSPDNLSPSELVREMQEILQILGYAPGPMDGLPGLRTRGALRRFQRDVGISVTGRLDEMTQLALADAWSQRMAQTEPPSHPELPTQSLVGSATVEYGATLPPGWTYDLVVGHSNRIDAVAFNTDGETVASGSDDSTVKLWNARTGKLIRTLEGHGGNVKAVAFSMDGEMIVSGSDDNTVKLWNTRTGKLIRTIKGHGEDVKAVAFSPDGETIASGSDDSTVRLWNARTGKLIRTLAGDGGSVKAVAFSPDGETIVSGSWDSTVKLWNARTGKLIRTLEGHGGYITAVAFSTDGETIASGSWESTVKLLNARTGKLIRSLEGHGGYITSVAFSPDGETLVGGSLDSTVKLWNARAGKLIRTLEGHGGNVRAVAFSTDGETIVSGSDDNTAKLWNARTGKLIRTLEGHGGNVRAVAFSMNGETIASGSDDNTVKLWNARTGKLTRALEGHGGDVNAVAFSAGGEIIASGSDDNTVKLWNVKTGKLIRTLEGHGGDVNAVAFDMGGETIASGSDDRTVKLWNARTGMLTGTLEGHSGRVEAVAFSTGGGTIASGSDNNMIKLWNPRNGKLIRTLGGHGKHITAVAFSTDGETIASGSWDSTIKLLNARTGKLIRTLEGDGGDVNAVAFSTDGKTIASGSDDNTVKLWNARTGKLTRTLEGHGGDVNAVAFSTGGEIIASGSDDNTVKLWNWGSDVAFSTFVSYEGNEAASIVNGVLWTSSKDVESLIHVRGPGGLQIPLNEFRAQQTVIQFSTNPDR